jgi:hypothetical protein
MHLNHNQFDNFGHALEPLWTAEVSIRMRSNSSYELEILLSENCPICLTRAKGGHAAVHSICAITDHSKLNIFMPYRTEQALF